MNEQSRKLTDILAAFIDLVAKRLPDDVMQRLGELQAQETEEMARALYDAMFENMRRANELDRPTCQDTGMLQFFLRAGANFPYLAQMKECIAEAARCATARTPLRPNAVEVFSEKNTGNNTGTRAPWIDWDIVSDSSDLELDLYLSGGGSSLPGCATVLMPSQGYEAVAEYVFDAVLNRGINACPPLLVGVGVSACAPTAAVLSKKALLRRLGTHNPNPRAAQMEQLLEDGLNAMRLGPQGLTGSASVMGVHVEMAARHPATIAVGVSVGCWSHRRGTLRLHSDLTCEILTHRGVAL